MTRIKLLPIHIPNEGKLKAIFLDGHEFCILKKDNQLYVLDDSCPHAGASLGMGTCQNDWIICPKHDIRFNYKTGDGQTDKFKVKTYQVILEDNQYYITKD